MMELIHDFKLSELTWIDMDCELRNYIVVLSSSSCRDGLGRGRHEAMSGRCDLGRHLVGSGSMSGRPSKVHDVGPWWLHEIRIVYLLLQLFARK